MALPQSAPTLPDLIVSRAELCPDAELVVLGERRLSYREAEADSALLARGLLAAGVGKGTRVGLLMPNGPDWVLAWLAASRIGALVVPICTFYQSRELHAVLRHADVQVLLTAARFLGHDYLARLEEAVPALARHGRGALHLHALPCLRQIWVWGECTRSWARSAAADLELAALESPEIDREFLREVERSVTPADPALLVYTSGSTAEPKGALHTHGTLVRHAHQLNRRRGLRADDRLYTPMPLFWVGGLHTGLLACMDAGACLICEESFDAERTLELLERERVTLVLGWPYHGKALSEHPSFLERDLSRLRPGARNALLPPGMPVLDPALRPNWLGMTETFGPHCSGQMDELLADAQRGSFGAPMPGLEHRIVDPADGRPLSVGEEGEICVRGYALMQGIHKQEREETFDRDGFYHTGDRGWFGSDGHLYFTGRGGDVIKTAGANVSPREVELAIESFSEVKEAYVVGLPDADRGEIVAAAIVLVEGASIDPEELKGRLRSQLSAFKVPRYVLIMAKAELPETSTGKIQKSRLLELLIRRREA